jgi:hypothetical protein
MSSIRISDLAHSTALDARAMAGVRGGSSGSPWGPGVNVNLTVNQQIAQVQDIGVNVLNGNGVIGAGFTGPSIELSPLQWAKNEATLPRF